MTGTRNLHRFALLATACTFLLIVAGGLVTSTGSGLSVPDWPNTYGHFMFAFPTDQMVGGIFYEHSHRMIASVVGFLTVILAIWLWRRDERPWVRRLGFIALGLVVAQGVLGGLTVLFLLPTAISVGHATLAQTFFAVVASIALFTSRWWKSDGPHGRPARKGNSVVWLSAITAAAVFIQLILGALMRHTDSGLAVPDFPLAYGQILPSLSPGAIAQYNEQLQQAGIRIAADGPIAASQIVIHMIHRAWAVLVFVLVIWTSIVLAKLSSVSGRLPRFALLLTGLVVTQIILGALTVLSGKAVLISTAHVAAGALLLVSTVLVSLHAIRLWGIPGLSIAISFAPAPTYPAGEARS